MKYVIMVFILIVFWGCSSAENIEADVQEIIPKESDELRKLLSPEIEICDDLYPSERLECIKRIPFIKAVTENNPEIYNNPLIADSNVFNYKTHFIERYYFSKNYDDCSLIPVEEKDIPDDGSYGYWKIVDYYRKEAVNCYAKSGILNEDPNFCDGFNEWGFAHNLECNYLLMVSSNLTCEIITNGTVRDECNFLKYIETKEDKYCDLIEGSDSKCEAYQVTVKKDPEICHKRLGTMEKSYCKYQLAYETNDVELCNQVYKQRSYKYSGPELSEMCKSDIAKKIKDITICEGLNEFYCPYNFAMETNDIELCLEILSEFSSNNCLAIVAFKTQNLETCDKISKTEDKNLCIAKVYLYQNDPNLKITEVTVFDNEFLDIRAGLTGRTGKVFGEKFKIAVMNDFYEFVHENNKKEDCELLSGDAVEMCRNNALN